MPFKQYLHQLIAKMVYYTVFWLNCFLHQYGIHATISTVTIVTGSHIDHPEKFQARSTYVQIQEKHNKLLCISCYPLTAHQKQRWVTLLPHLMSGIRISRINWTVFPVSTEVIAQIHQLASSFKNHKSIVLTDKYGNNIIEKKISS